MLIYSADAARVISINDQHDGGGVLRIGALIDESMQEALAEFGNLIETGPCLLRERCACCST
jgi:hypothetical protein